MRPTLEIPSPGHKLQWGTFPGSGDALALARAAVGIRPLVIVTARAADAQRLKLEMEFFHPGLRAYLLPDWETLPYDVLSPHQDLISERLSALWQLSTRACDVLLTSATTALMRLPPPEFLSAYTFILAQGDKLDGEAFRARLVRAGYSHVTQVVSPGEFSIRGSIIDLFPMGSALPYRIDLFSDQIDSVRTFDVDTQRSIYKVKDLRLLPAREFPSDDEARTRFRARFREHIEGDPTRSRIYKDVSAGLMPPGIEYYLPLFFDQTALLSDYLPAESAVCLHGEVSRAMTEFWSDTESRYRLLRGDKDRPLLAPGELFLRDDAFFSAIKPFARADMNGGAPPATGLPDLSVDRRAERPLGKLAHFLDATPHRVLLTTESPGRRETLLASLTENGFNAKAVENFAAFEAAADPFCVTVSPLHSGFVEGDMALVTENELYPLQARTRSARDRSATVEGMLRDLSEVKVGDPVVHAHHGIGRYLGLATLDLGDGPTEFLTLEYRDGDKLYVPVAQLSVISRYSGAQPEAAPLHKLGSGDWDKAKKKAAGKVRDTAAELLNLYAQRASRKGYAFSLKNHDYELFREGFPFEETVDQASAIQAVIDDLRSGRPMDRLVCGDVGFGKTEVALRAAFVAVMDGKQVAVLVPTTLLAEQHFQTFSDRFADWPVKIAELSRFRSAKEQNATLVQLSEGKVDIAIGTHKLVQSGVKFKNLGLVIIDEEHRFGVRHKEQLKALRAEVDVLTLTATPIPRTLAMSLEGLRDFSVIASPPQRRLAIKTFVAPYSEGQVREALLRELKRGGQVYFLHNDIETIGRMQEHLEKLVPEARIRIAHGQMPERELELAMRDFHQQRFNVLLCTTIIETGIDVPTANTIVIHRADKFGLAQLHQLRGRVGRSHHQAYAYLLTPDEEAIGAQAKKRLEAITMMEELGSGFFLAMHDLEIRGAGEVLGESQSGEMLEVGFSLYSQMLEQAVRSLKAGKEPDLAAPLAVTIEINLHVPALLPEDYCPDVHERLVIYKRLANCDDAESLTRLNEELIDRFGLLPDAAQALVETHRLRIESLPVGIQKIDAGPDTIAMQFIPNPPIEPQHILGLIQQKRNYQLSGPDRIRITLKSADLPARVANVRSVLKDLVTPLPPVPARKK
jgi:transcription-repair coupling factor (superfamily II helicase)